MSKRRWLRSPRRLLIALGATATISAGALTWLAQEMLQHDRAVKK